MSDHLTEEEQIEAIKQWWSANWKLVVFPVVIIAVTYFGISFNKSSQVAKAASASDAYQVLMERLEVGPVESLKDNAVAEVRSQAETIASSYSKTLYADMSTLILARIDVKDGLLDSAEARLRKVANEGVNPAISEMVKTRLAKVLIAQQKYDQALQVVANTSDAVYQPAFAEIRGDIFFMQNNFAAAKTAYEDALQLLQPAQQQQKSVIELKLNGTNVNLADSNVAEANRVSEETPEAAEAGDA